MMYRPRLKKAAIKYLDGQSDRDVARISKAITNLPEGDVVKLQGRDGYRLTVGGFRVLFDYTNETTEDGKKIIDVTAIGPRGDVYKNRSMRYMAKILEKGHNAARGDAVQSQAVKKILVVLDGLSESSQISVLKFAEFLAASEADEWLPYDEAEMEEDIRLYDEAKANDDEYRISLEDLRRKYDT